MQVDALDVAAAGVLEHAEPQLLTMLSGQLIAASSHKGAQEAERSGSIASAAAAAQVSPSCDPLVPNYRAMAPQILQLCTIIPHIISPWHYPGILSAAVHPTVPSVGTDLWYRGWRVVLLGRIAAGSGCMFTMLQHEAGFVHVQPNTTETTTASWA